MSNSDTFQDFCQAWRSRFPHSELPAAWEEDVRANLAKHQARVDSLREELEKEEMYVEYLDKLLADIELHRQQKRSSLSNGSAGDTEAEGQPSLDYTVTSGTLDNKQSNKQPDNKQQTKHLDNKQKFLEDQCELHTQTKASNLRASLHLDLDTVNADLEEEEEEEEEAPGVPGVPSSFVTVINVKSPGKKEGAAGSESSQEPGSKLTFTKSKSSHKKVPPPPVLGKPTPPQRQDSRESLNSISSPLSPTSPLSEHLLMSPREAPASPVESSVLPDESSSDSSAGPGLTKTKPEVPVRSISMKEEAERKSHSSSEDLAPASQSRGRPDGGEEEEEAGLSRQVSSPDCGGGGGKVADLRANWENKPPIAVKPAERRSKRESGSPSVGRRPLKTRTDSDSSRGRMGSPSGKSHDSSDSEHSWGRGAARDSRLAGETRLDRLGRRPSAEKAAASLAPALPKPRKLNKPWQPHSLSLTNGKKERQGEEPLYDTVANDEAEDDYDNHLLLYTDTELAKSQSLTGSGTLSSSTDTDGFSGSPSLIRKVVQMDDEESNYVNIQYFLHHTKSRNTLDTRDRDRSLDPFDESDDENCSNDKTSQSPNNNSLDSTKSREKSINEAERQLMYRHILNSITESEAIYLECLSVSLQYMKAMKVTLATPQPVIPKEDFDVIFFKIPELHEFHYHFHESLKKQVERYTGDEKIGHHFKMLAQQTKVYAKFLGNYPAALETLHRCIQLYPQFADLTSSIKLRTLKGQQQGQSLSMEDLLHKPVARVQKNCLSLQDLIKYTPEDHQDFTTLTESLHMIQNFLNDYNLEHRGEVYPHGGERNQRHLVKNSFTVELSDGSRKLRHLFLFNDVLVCAKYKASGRGEKFTFQLKWYIPLSEVNIVIKREH